MCGITGFFGRGNEIDLGSMMKMIEHRGPDGKGVFIDPELPTYLGHQRLSVIDIDTGRQPMCNEFGTVWVVFNGEIYNHQSLRKQLLAKGHVFTSNHSDTEVLVHGWEEWGTDLPSKLNGMFSFAIWDQTSKSLFLARDRFGEKPLFWALQQGLFLFGSEITAIAAHSKFDKCVNSLALKKFFAYGFIPSPTAILNDCEKLSPGHWLLFDTKLGSVRQEKYWQYRIEIANQTPTFDEAAEEIEHLLIQSVKRRMMSDVPLGVFLSGGVDSSAVAAAMCRLISKDKVQSYSIGFHEKTFDESAYARSMAEYLKTDHNERIFDLSAAKKIANEVLSKLDEPMGDSSLLPTYLLCQFARKKVTVALSGDAGDEIFAGYDPFRALAPAQLYHNLVPNVVHGGIKRLADLLPKSKQNMSFDFKLRRVLMGLDYGAELWNPSWMAPLSLSELSDLFQEPCDMEELYGEALSLWRENDRKSYIDKTQEYFTTIYLPDDILTKVDRAAMLNGLETRSIFLDNDLVNFARTLPSEYKYDGKTTKKILKSALARMVPKEILDRPKKGFGIPLLRWLEDLDVRPPNLGGMDESIAQRMIQTHRTEKQDYRFYMWNSFVLQNSSLLNHR